MGTPSDQHYHLRWNNHRSNFVEVFDQLLENEIFTDVTLAVDGGEFVKCHKMVLAACSPYFKALFTELPCTHPIVVLKDVKCREMKAVLEYMYTGEVKVTQANLPALFKVAEILKVKGLVASETSTSSDGEQRNEEAISTSTTSAGITRNFENTSNSSATGGGGQSSPPHSTSSPYYGYGKSPTARNQEPKLPLPMCWALSQALSLQHTSADSAAAAAIQSVRQHSMFSSHYDNQTTEQATTTHSRRNKITSNSMMRNHDTPILRNVLGQGHVDSSISHRQQQTDPHEMHYRSTSNGSANNESDDRRINLDTPNCPPAHSPYATDTSMMEDDEKKISPQSYADDAKAANYGTSQKPEWKRYKQYTREDIANAIEAVRCGMSALQAARKFGVPSRTLYDKVKKLGITTSRPFRRSANGSGACFPYGVGGNINGSIYGTISESENENSNVLVDNPASLLETTFVESRDNSRDRESIMELARRSSSPRPLSLYSHRQITNEEPLPPSLQQQQEQHREQQQQQQHQQPMDDSEENEVEDLSVSRRPEVGVIMSPSITIKEEH